MFTKMVSIPKYRYTKVQVHCVTTILESWIKISNSDYTTTVATCQDVDPFHAWINHSNTTLSDEIEGTTFDTLPKKTVIHKSHNS